MNSFAILLSDSADPGSRQAAARAQLPSMLAQANLHYWLPSMPISANRVLVGIATWSRDDLDLLDLLHAAATGEHQMVIDVFDVDDCDRLADFEQYVPGIGHVFQTPVVGIWRDGVLASAGWGADGRALLAKIGLLE